MAKGRESKIAKVTLNWNGRPSPGKSVCTKKTPPSIEVLERVFPDTLAQKIKEPTGRLIEGDNLDIMRSLLSEGPAIRAKLIYMDPPFLSKALYHQKITINDASYKIPAYSDRWRSQGEYLDMLHPRLTLARKLLSDDGILFVHCDWRASAHIRLLLDEVFGAENFLNEIIWHYGGRGAKATSGQFPRNHDTIFVYGKTKKARLHKVYSEEVLTVDEALAKGYKIDEDGRVFKTAPRGDYTDASIKRLDKEGRIYRTKTGTVRVKYFLDRSGKNKVIDKKLIGDVWTDIPDLMHSPVKERTGYATQKPIALIERIIESATDKDDLILDIFSGSGTTPLKAEAMGRRYIATDKNPSAIRLARARLIGANARPFTIESATKERQRSKLTIKKPVIKKLNNRRISIAIEIKSYTPTKKTLGKVKEAAGDLKCALTTLLDYWTIDWNYDGRVFNALWSSSRGHGKATAPLTLTAKVEAMTAPKRIAVRAADIFDGHTGIIVIDL